MPTQFYKIFLVLTILSLGLAWSAVPAASASQDPGIHLLQEDDQGLTLELVTPEFQIQEGLAESQPCQIIQVEGYGSTDTSGYPEIPLRGTLVGVPPNSTPTLTVVDSSPAAAVGQHNLCPVGQPILEGELEGQARYGGEKLTRRMYFHQRKWQAW
jgi:hypothetical protein